MPLVKRKEDKKSKKYPELRREKKDKVSVGEKKGLQQRKNKENTPPKSGNVRKKP